MGSKKAISKTTIKLILIAIVILFVAIIIVRAGLIDVFKNLPIFKSSALELTKIEGVMINGEVKDIILNDKSDRCKIDKSVWGLNLRTKKLEYWTGSSWDNGKVDDELSEYVSNVKEVENLNWKWELRDALRLKKDNLYLNFEGGVKMQLDSWVGLSTTVSKGTYGFGRGHVYGKQYDDTVYLWKLVGGKWKEITKKDMEQMPAGNDKDWHWELYKSFTSKPLELPENKLDFDTNSNLILDVDESTLDKTEQKIIFRAVAGGQMFAIDSSGDLYWIGTGENIVNLKTTGADKFLNLNSDTKEGKKGWKDYLWEARLKKTLIEICIEER